MFKHKNVLMLSIIQVMGMFAGFSWHASVYAAESSDTLEVWGQGAPSVPSLSVYGFIVDTPITATHGTSTDPDGDPINYEVRWCTGTNGTGTCVTGATQTFTNKTTRYVAVRAVTPRGYPSSTQGQSNWSPETTSVVGDLIEIPGVGMFSKPDGLNKNWTSADAYCSNLTSGGFSDWRLATESELKGVYTLYPSGTVRARFDWPAGTTYYWTSTVGTLGTGHRYVGFLDGASGNSGNAIARNVTCIRN